jgi:hypothetical protein
MILQLDVGFVENPHDPSYLDVDLGRGRHDS